MASTKPSTVGQSLFIVDRDWLRQGSKARKSWTGNVRNRSLYGLAIEVTDYEASQKVAKTKGRSKTKRRRLDKPEKMIQLQDDLNNGLTPTALMLPSSASPTSYLDADCKTPEDVPCTITISDVFQLSDNVPLQRTLPRSSSFDSIKGLECYLDYYLDVIGTAQHPLETKFSHQSDLARTRWEPMAFEDDLWLQNMALFSVFQQAGRRKEPSPATAEALMSTFLSQLNDRISKSDLSDGTIASVSCLMLGEHIKGNDELARVHASGMAEMIRLRGGLGTIQRARRSKIARTDVVRSVDTLEPPMLPRLTRDSVPLGPGLPSPPDQYRERINQLRKSGISPELTSTLWTLGSICETIELAWIGYTTLDATPFYESILCINHDMLSFTPRTGFDEVLKISIINFTQPMFRQCAFSEQSCRLRVQKLKSLLEEHDICKDNEDVVLWVIFVAYMTAQQVLSDCDWFKAKMISSLENFSIPHIGSWNELKYQLQDFLWTDSIHDRIGLQSYETLDTNLVQLAPHPSDVCISCLDPTLS